MTKNVRRNNGHSPEIELGLLTHTNLVSVPKARRILGSLTQDLSDDQVKDLVHSLHLLAREQLCYNGSKISGISYNEHTT